MTNCKLITSVERRRRWSLEEKKGQSVSQIARRCDINQVNFLHGKGKWNKEYYKD